MQRTSSCRLSRTCAAALVIAAAPTLAIADAHADDLASTVAKAREQVETGAYADAAKTLARLPKEGLPATLAVEAAILETTAALVASGPQAGQAACAKAIVASGYDPEVARDQSPKVRAACRAAAAAERTARLAREKITLQGLDIAKPEVAWQPVRISTTASAVPSWLRVVARVTSSALEGSFDLALAPSLEGPLRGTLDPSWIRPSAKISVVLVAQDKFGDLGPVGATATVDVPKAEAMIALGNVATDAAVSVDGAAIKLDASGAAPVAPGRHTVAIELPNGASASTTIDVQRGGVARVALSPQKPGGGVGWHWIVGAGAVSLAAVGGVFYGLAQARTSEIEDLSQQREPGTNLPATEYSALTKIDDERKTFQAVGTGLMIGAGTAAVIALTLGLWPESKPKRRATGVAHAAPPKPRGVTLLPSIGPGAAYVTGTF